NSIRFVPPDVCRPKPSEEPVSRNPLSIFKVIIWPTSRLPPVKGRFASTVCELLANIPHDRPAVSMFPEEPPAFPEDEPIKNPPWAPLASPGPFRVQAPNPVPPLSRVCHPSS